MEAARKTARDHISRILRSYPIIIPSLPLPFCFFVLFLSTLRLQDEKINIVYNEKRKHKGKQRFDFSFSTQVLGYTILFSFSFYLLFSFFCFASISFYFIPSSFCFVPVLSFFFLFFLSDFKVFRISLSLRNLILLGLAVSRMHADTSGTLSLSLFLALMEQDRKLVFRTVFPFKRPLLRLLCGVTE